MRECCRLFYFEVNPLFLFCGVAVVVVVAASISILLFLLVLSLSSLLCCVLELVLCPSPLASAVVCAVSRFSIPDSLLIPPPTLFSFLLHTLLFAPRCSAVLRSRPHCPLLGWAAHRPSHEPEREAGRSDEGPCDDGGERVPAEIPLPALSILPAGNLRAASDGGRGCRHAALEAYAVAQDPAEGTSWAIGRLSLVVAEGGDLRTVYVRGEEIPAGRAVLRQKPSVVAGSFPHDGRHGRSILLRRMAREDCVKIFTVGGSSVWLV